MGVAVFDEWHFVCPPSEQPRAKTLPLGGLPEIGAIAQLVAARFGVRLADVFSRDRHKQVTLVRHVTWWIARRVTLASFPELGRAMGNRDHTTVMAACRRVDELLEQDRERWWPILSELLLEAGGLTGHGDRRLAAE